MINITFKNVGQGDTIIIEYSQGERNLIGLIDCNRYNGENPALIHIKGLEFDQIEFIILSHPHKDHFSGMLELLAFCKEKDIRIKYFLHTCGQVPDWLIAAANNADTEKALQELFNFLQMNHEEMDIHVSAIQGDNPYNNIPLSNGYSLKILSPTQTELNNFVAAARYGNDNSGAGNNPRANWLSTIIKIENENEYVLLTSDAEKYSLIRIDTRRSEELEKTLIIGQSPHHGAENNHNNAFWKKRKRINATPIVFSVGHNGYNHPSKNAVSSFLNNEYDIHSTNLTGGLLKVKNAHVVRKKHVELNTYSSVVVLSKSKTQGDQFFTLSK